MDRFIVKKHYSNYGVQKDLKSNMDRFIVFKKGIDKQANLI